MKHFKNDCQPLDLTFGHDHASLFCMNCGAIESCGYYIPVVGEHSPEIRVEIYGVRKNQVLIKDIGLDSYSWINVRESQIVML